MRNRAKGMTDSGLFPSEPLPPDQPLKISPRPLCLVCHRPIARLPYNHIERNEPRPFCSEKCGYAFGLNVFIHGRFRWCEEHQSWTTAEGVCPECDIEHAQADDRITVPDLAGIAAEKGVDRG